jgi:hypothetical protein
MDGISLCIVFSNIKASSPEGPDRDLWIKGGPIVPDCLEERDIVHLDTTATSCKPKTNLHDVDSDRNGRQGNKNNARTSCATRGRYDAPRQSAPHDERESFTYSACHWHDPRSIWSQSAGSVEREGFASSWMN